MDALFGTDGIRGRANREPLVPGTLARIGRAIGETLAASGARRRVLLGRDPRRSGPMVGGAVMAGLLSAGIDVTVAGVLPTPAVARLARARRFGLGVVISASHNPAGDNGVKVFTGDARKADPAFEAEVGDRLAREGGPAPDGTGAYRAWPDAAEAYLDDLLREFDDLDLGGMKIVVDCANGAVSATAPTALARIGAEVVSLHAKPDGENINRRCGATRPGVAARGTVRHGADLGVSFDGDGDRALFADEGGRVLDGDAVLAILARDLLARRRLPHRTVVATVMSNVGLERSLREAGCRLVRTGVGDRLVAEEMARGGFALGGEQSGHLIVRRGRRLVGDGLETALHLLRALRGSGGPLSGLAACMRCSPQVLVNVRVREQPPVGKLPLAVEAIRRVEGALGDEGRVLVRYSGTEPLARVMVEGPTPRRTRNAAEEIAAAIQKSIGKGS